MADGGKPKESIIDYGGTMESVDGRVILPPIMPADIFIGGPDERTFDKTPRRTGEDEYEIFCSPPLGMRDGDIFGTSTPSTEIIQSERMIEVKKELKEILQRFESWSHARRRCTKEDLEMILEEMKEIKEKLLKTPEFLEWEGLKTKPFPYMSRSYAECSSDVVSNCMVIVSLYMTDLYNSISKLGRDAKPEHSVVMGQLTNSIIRRIERDLEHC